MKLKEILKYRNANGKPYMCDIKKLDRYEIQELLSGDLSEHNHKRYRQPKPNSPKA